MRSSSGETTASALIGDESRAAALVEPKGAVAFTRARPWLQKRKATTSPDLVLCAQSVPNPCRRRARRLALHMRPPAMRGQHRKGSTGAHKPANAVAERRNPKAAAVCTWCSTDFTSSSSRGCAFQQQLIARRMIPRNVILSPLYKVQEKQHLYCFLR